MKKVWTNVEITVIDSKSEDILTCSAPRPWWWILPWPFGYYEDDGGHHRGHGDEDEHGWREY